MAVSWWDIAPAIHAAQHRRGQGRQQHQQASRHRNVTSTIYYVRLLLFSSSVGLSCACVKLLREGQLLQYEKLITHRST